MFQSPGLDPCSPFDVNKMYIRYYLNKPFMQRIFYSNVGGVYIIIDKTSITGKCRET